MAEDKVDEFVYPRLTALLQDTMSRLRIEEAAGVPRDSHAASIESNAYGLELMARAQACLQRDAYPTTVMPCLSPGTGRLASELHTWGNLHEALDEQVFALIHELVEFRNWTNWKKWRRTYRDALPPDVVNEMKVEVVDMMHFMLNLMNILGLTGAELLTLYFAKRELNIVRQQEGY